MTTTPITGAAVGLALLLLAACGSDAPESRDSAGQASEQRDTTAAPDQPDAPDSDAAGDADAPGDPAPVRGIVTVDGVDYEITQLRNCDPYEMDMIEVDLELQGIGEHNGERVQIDVYIQTIGGAPFDDVSWAGPEGIFGGPDDAVVTLDSSGTSVSGSATLVDALNQVDTVSISFEMDVPSDILACR